MPAAFIWPIKAAEREKARDSWLLFFRVLRGVKLIPDEGMSDMKVKLAPSS